MKKIINRILVVCIIFSFVFSFIMILRDWREIKNNKSVISDSIDSQQSSSDTAYKQKVELHYKSESRLSLIGFILGLVIPASFLYTGLSARLRNFSKESGGNWFFTIFIYGFIYLIMNYLIKLPFNFYGNFIQSHAFGLSNQSFGRWLGNSIISLALEVGISLLVLWIPYRIMDKSPKNWWIYVGVLTIPIIIFGTLISPLYVDPLFNNFQPMEDKALEQKLLNLTKRANIDNCNIFQVDKSKDTNTLNAYMTGLGNTKRIVIWDTTLKKLNSDEISFVTAHEIGHYVLGHIKKQMLFEVSLIFLVLFIVANISSSIIRRNANVFGFNRLRDVASLPLIILIINLCMIFISPISNSYTIYQEKQADTFAIELTRDNASGISTFEKLKKDNLSVDEPGPIYKIWNYDHPTLKDRIEFCREYKPWEKGEELRYRDIIK